MSKPSENGIFKECIAPRGTNTFLSKLTQTEKESKNINGRGASYESVPILKKKKWDKNVPKNSTDPDQNAPMEQFDKGLLFLIVYYIGLLHCPNVNYGKL